MFNAMWNTEIRGRGGKSRFFGVKSELRQVADVRGYILYKPILDSLQMRPYKHLPLHLVPACKLPLHTNDYHIHHTSPIQHHTKIAQHPPSLTSSQSSLAISSSSHYLLSPPTPQNLNGTAHSPSSPHLLPSFLHKSYSHHTINPPPSPKTPDHSSPDSRTCATTPQTPSAAPLPPHH